MGGVLEVTVKIWLYSKLMEYKSEKGQSFPLRTFMNSVPFFYVTGMRDKQDSWGMVKDQL